MAVLGVAAESSFVLDWTRESRTRNCTLNILGRASSRMRLVTRRVRRACLGRREACVGEVKARLDAQPGS